MSDVAPREVTIPLPEGQLSGFLWSGQRGLVLFAHGSGSGRFSERNWYVARTLVDAGLGALLFDLLTEREQARDERTAEYRFDIPLLNRRLVAAIDWALSLADRPPAVGLFGASTGAAAAIRAAADRPADVAAIVSRGGRPDLAGEALSRISAAILLIVGGRDEQVIGLNQAAFAKIRCEKSLEIVPGATHLFEEPGTLDAASALARDWFLRHLVSPGR